jgi:hypothetical protein
VPAVIRWPAVIKPGTLSDLARDRRFADSPLEERGLARRSHHSRPAPHGYHHFRHRITDDDSRGPIRRFGPFPHGSLLTPRWRGMDSNHRFPVAKRRVGDIYWALGEVRRTSNGAPRVENLQAPRRRDGQDGQALAGHRASFMTQTDSAWPATRNLDCILALRRRVASRYRGNDRGPPSGVRC